MDVLTNHQWDDGYETLVVKKREQYNTNNDKNNESENDPGGTSLAQMNPTGYAYPKVLTCFCCGKTGHYTNACHKYETTKKEDWAVIMPVDKEENRKNKVNWRGTQVEQEIEQGFNGCQVHRKFNLQQAHKKIEPRRVNFNDDLILDTGATFNSIKNKSLLAGVYVAKNPIQICTNTGEWLLE